MIFFFSSNKKFPVIYGVIVMVFNATFKNISVILWLSVLLVEETRVPWEDHRPVASHWQTLSCNVVSLVVIGTCEIWYCKIIIINMFSLPVFFFDWCLCFTIKCDKVLDFAIVPVSDVYVLEEFEDTKGVIRIHILKNRQHNGQKNKQRSIKHTHKTKRLSNTNSTKNRGWTQALWKGKQFSTLELCLCLMFMSYFQFCFFVLL